MKEQTKERERRRRGSRRTRRKIRREKKKENDLVAVGTIITLAFLRETVYSRLFCIDLFYFCIEIRI